MTSQVVPLRCRRALLALPAWLLLLATLPAAAAAPASPRARDAGAEQFVQSQAQRIIGVLADRRMPEAEKRRLFHQTVDQVVDVPRVTTFVLGKYARTATPAQRQEFATVFRRYAESVYEKRIGDYRGQTLAVTGSVARKPGDVVVSSTVKSAGSTQPLPIAWRVLDAGDGWKVVDVQVRGVWLAITQQQDFVSTIDQAHGDVGVLTAQLRTAIADGQPVRAR